MGQHKLLCIKNVLNLFVWEESVNIVVLKD